MNNQSVYNLLTNASFLWPENPAIHDEYGTVLYKELNDEVNVLKVKLISLGVKSGMCVGVRGKNSRNFIIAVFAVLGCGAAVMPISYQLKKREITEIIDETKIHVILDDCNGFELSLNIIEKIKLNIDELIYLKTEVEESHIFAGHVNNPAFIRYTSGTTGLSKGVVISNKSVLERIEAANKSLKISTNSNVVWVLPMAYHFIVSIVLYIKYGASISIINSFMAKNVIEMTNSYKGTILYASPLQIRLLASDNSKVMMPSLKKVISTSSGISQTVSKLFMKRYNIVVNQAFGIIEIGLPIVNTEVSDQFLESVGYALPDFDVKVFDTENKILPAGEIGILGIKGPGMFDAYLNPPLLREKVLKDGYFQTADYAIISKNGMIKIKGRKKSMINVAGNKVFAEEVEKVLEELSYVQMARVSGTSHLFMGQVIQAEIKLIAKEKIDVEKVLNYCRENLSTFKIPQKIIVVEDFPITKTGKLKRF